MLERTELMQVGRLREGYRRVVSQLAAGEAANGTSRVGHETPSPLKDRLPFEIAVFVKED
jgi:hypothetical protein